MSVGKMSMTVDDYIDVTFGDSLTCSPSNHISFSTIIIRVVVLASIGECL